MSHWATTAGRIRTGRVLTYRHSRRWRSHAALSSFHEPALDVLWSRQDGLSHLVECLPSDLWAILDDHHGTLTLNEPTRPTTHQDWERLEFHARRVRSLRYGLRKSPLDTYLRTSRVLSGNLFRWLLSSSPSHHLLPRLRFLEWSGSDIPFDYYDSTHMLFGPQLSTLDIGTCPQMLAHLHRRSPDTQDLHIHTNGNGGPDSDHQPKYSSRCPYVVGTA